MKKTSVLIINTNGMGYEGITQVILNYLRHMSIEDLDLHFSASESSSVDVRKTLEHYGTVHVIPAKKKNLVGYIKGLNQCLKNGFDVVHVHGNSGMMAIETVIARFRRVPKILTHCHNTQCSHPKLNCILTFIMCRCATERLACSDGSGEWLYGKRSHRVLNNAIDLKKFSFDDRVRREVREELLIGDSYLVGHIGMFVEAKNHSFLVEVFEEFHRRYPNSKLLLISDGPEYQNVKQQVKNLGLQEQVIFAGRRTDVNRLYQAMDAFVLPSRWEGLPLVALEAQAVGLPVLASDCITRDIACTSNVNFLSINDKASVWAEKLEELATNPMERVSGTEQLRMNGFDIELEAECLKKIYLQ